MAASALILQNNFTEEKAKIAGFVKPIKQIPLDEQVVNSIRDRKSVV